MFIDKLTITIDKLK